MKEKEKKFFIIITIIIALFIIFMPKIESLLAGRKVRNSDTSTENSSGATAGEINESKEYPIKTTCELSETADENGTILNKNVVFEYDVNGAVETINLTKEYKYLTNDLYNKNKNQVATDRLGVKQIIENDDNEMTVAINEYMTISQMTDLSEYPTSYSELKSYLKNNKYSCKETK